jgi:hypothetical protein
MPHRVRDTFDLSDRALKPAKARSTGARFEGWIAFYAAKANPAFTHAVAFLGIPAAALFRMWNGLPTLRPNCGAFPKGPDATAYRL